MAGVVPEYRGLGIAETILRRLAAIGAGHGLDALVAPVRPTWKDRYPLVALDRYAGWRRADGLPYDPWLRTHERLGGELLAMAPRSMTISGTRAEWEEWTGMVFPEDGNYVVPGALVPVHFKNGRGVYVEPNVWVRHVALGRAASARFCCFSSRRGASGGSSPRARAPPCCSCISSSAARSSRVSRDIAFCACWGSWSCFACGSSFRIALASSGFVRSIAAFDAFSICRLRNGTFAISPNSGFR